MELNQEINLHLWSIYFLQRSHDNLVTKRSSFQHVAGPLDNSCTKKQNNKNPTTDPYATLQTKINSKSIRNLNITSKTSKSTSLK